MNLRLKLLGPLLLITVLMGGYLYGIWIPGSLANARQEHLHRVVNHLDSVVESLIPMLLSSQLDAIHENLTALKAKNRDWVNIRLVDAAGRLLYPMLAQSAAPPPTGAPQEQIGVERSISFLGSDLGTLHIQVDFSQALANDRRHHHQLGLMLSIMAIIFLFTLSANLEITVRRPVHQLAAASRELARRHFDTPLPAEKKDEIGTLICSFAAMRDDLRQHHDSLLHEIEERRKTESELRLYRSHLEELVTARTRELEARNHSLSEALELVNRTQRELIESEKMASLGRLVAGFAHEINTPIGVAVGASSHALEATRKIRPLLEQDEVDEAELGGYLSEVDEASRLVYTNLARASELVGSFKRTSVDQTRGTARLYNLSETLRDVVASLHDQLKRAPVEVSVACDPHIQLYGYPGALGQIITNLVTNTLKHGLNGDTPVKIRITAQLQDEEILVDYQDTGKGMDEATRARLFEPFFTTARESGGTGLGLFICHNLATAELKGTLRCESQPGEGTRFLLRYPVGQAPQIPA